MHSNHCTIGVPYQHEMKLYFTWKLSTILPKEIIWKETILHRIKNISKTGSIILTFSGCDFSLEWLNHIIEYREWSGIKALQQQKKTHTPVVVFKCHCTIYIADVSFSVCCLILLALVLHEGYVALQYILQVNYISILQTYQILGLQQSLFNSNTNNTNISHVQPTNYYQLMPPSVHLHKSDSFVTRV